MECISNLIGFSEYCGLPGSESGRYVTDLPGISVEMTNKIANSDQVTFMGLWEKAQSLAFLKLKNDMIAALADQAKFNNVIYKNSLPKRTATVLNPTNELRGVYVRMPESQYAQLRIPFIYLYSANASIATISILDAEINDEVIESFDMPVSKGFNKIPINKVLPFSFDASAYFIGVDASSLTLNELIYTDSLGFEECGITRCACGDDFYIVPATLDNDIVNLGANNFSVWPQLEIICSMESFICENAEQLTEPLLYALGYQLLDYKVKVGVGSKQLNFFTTTNTQVTKDTRDSLKADYENSLKQVVKALILHDPVCFGCSEESAAYTVSSMP